MALALLCCRGSTNAWLPKPSRTLTSAAASAGARLSTGERSPFVFGSLSRWLLPAKCELPRTMHATRAARPTPCDSWKGSGAYADE